MKKLLALTTVLLTTAAALAQQDDAPPPAPAKPAVHAKSKAKAAPAGPPKSLAEKLLACLDIDDETKERLVCYDAAIPPTTKPPKGKGATTNGVIDCRLVKEEDERLKCFNGFAEKIPKFSTR
jgi:hypothetical protein